MLVLADAQAHDDTQKLLLVTEFLDDCPANVPKDPDLVFELPPPMAEKADAEMVDDENHEDHEEHEPQSDGEPKTDVDEPTPSEPPPLPFTRHATSF